jgi:hypothetical protein
MAKAIGKPRAMSNNIPNTLMAKTNHASIFSLAEFKHSYQ